MLRPWVSGSLKPPRTSASPRFPFSALEQLLPPGRGVPHSGVLAAGEFLKCEESQNPQQVSESAPRPEPCAPVHSHAKATWWERGRNRADTSLVSDREGPSPRESRSSTSGSCWRVQCNSRLSATHTRGSGRQWLLRCATDVIPHAVRIITSFSTAAGDRRAPAESSGHRRGCGPTPRGVSTAQRSFSAGDAPVLLWGTSQGSR